jgi:hypothetical protein
MSAVEDIHLYPPLSIHLSIYPSIYLFLHLSFTSLYLDSTHINT